MKLKSAKSRRPPRARQLLAVVTAFLCSGVGAAVGFAECPHCALADAVVASLDSDLTQGAEGIVLSEVRVESADEYCPYCDEVACDEVAESAPVISTPVMSACHCDDDACDGRGCDGRGCDGRGCDGRGHRSSVRDELWQRRQNELAACWGLRSRIQVVAGAVYMDRVTESFRVLMESTSNPIRQINAEDFDFGWQPGLDVSASCIGWDDREFEFRFLGLSQFSARQGVDTNGSDVRINSNPPVFAPNVQSLDAHYTSDLYGFELNWHYVTYCPFQYIAGFRYVALDEDLVTEMDSDLQTFRYRTATTNDLYGVQIGIESVPDRPLFGWSCLSWFGKAGIYGNDARQRTVLDTDLIGQVVSESPTTSAVVWEFGLGLDFPLSDCFSIQGGYSALILQRVAIASDQLSTIDFLDATGSHDRGVVMFHGATLSVSCRL